MQYLNSKTIIDDIKTSADSVKLDINYSYNEKFILWDIKEKYACYLKKSFDLK